MAKTVGHAAQHIIAAVLLSVAPLALAQTDGNMDTADAGNEAESTAREDMLTGREEPIEDGDTEYVNIPEIIAIGKRWRLDDEVKEELWRAEQAQEARNLKEREYSERFKDGAVATATSDGGRFKAEFLPLYDPRNARVIDMGMDNSHSEVVDLFKGKF